MDEKQNNESLQRYRNLRPLLSDYIDYYAKITPAKSAIIEVNTSEIVSYKVFKTKMDAFAAKLLSMGLKRGDIIATSLPFLKEHVFLQYGAFKIGVVIAPLDLRLKAQEILYSLDKIKPKAYFFLGKTDTVDFRPIISEVKKNACYVEHWIQFQKEKDLVIDGAIGVKEWASDIKWLFIKSRLLGTVKRANARVCTKDAALIIFTTGSTGAPKPALLSHKGILVQNIGLGVGLDVHPEDRMVVNLPPSHVGGQTEQLMTMFYMGGTVLLLHIFDPHLTLEAIRKYKATIIGQIPALFNMEWRLPDYDKFDLSSLRLVLYGGQTVDKPFLEKMQKMAPNIATGLGLTETSGFCTYTPFGAGVDAIIKSIGFDMPLFPISIREPMDENGNAGPEKEMHEVGEITFSGDQLFLGYLGDDDATAKTISKDEFLYTGDMGYYDNEGLHFAGRSKFVVKPKGYQVFPAEVEGFITERFKDRVVQTGVVGVPHQVFSEGIVAFVELRKDAQLTKDEVDAAASDIAAYKRPGHVVFLSEGRMPLNRVAKIDYQALKKMALEEIERLRAEGGWDANL